MMHRWLRRGGAHVALGTAAVLYVLPVLFMLAGSLKPDDRVLSEASTWRAIAPTDVSLANYRDVFARVDFGRYLGNSLVISISVVVAGLVINSMAGYAFARLRWRGRDATFTVVLALMIVPFEAIAVPLFYEVTVLGWRDTYIVQILPFLANAFSIFLFYSFFIGMPAELEEAARIDGASPARAFLSIIVPNARPVFATVAILTFLTQWGMFLWPLLVTGGDTVRPLPVALSTFHTLPPLAWGDILAFAVMMVTPVLLAFLGFQGAFVRGVAASGIKE